MSTSRKMWGLLNPAERNGVLVLFGLMAVGMILETLGVGLVVPAIALMMQGDITVHYPAVAPVLRWLGNPDSQTLLVGAMLGLVIIYLAKNLFLAYCIWWRSRFTVGVQLRLSKWLFTIYLRQPYAFHLQRNSAQLIRNVTSEVGSFVGALTDVLNISAEGLVLLGISVLLLKVEPLGALIVVPAFGVAAWAFHRITRRHTLRWGELRMHHAVLSTQHLMQGLGGAKDVKLLGRENDFLDQYHLHNTEGERVNRYQTTLQGIPRLWLELLAVGGLATLVLTMLAQGRGMASIVPTVGLFAVAAFRLMPSVNRVLSSVQNLRYTLPVIHSIYNEFQLAAPDLVAKVRRAPAFQDQILLTDISYTYPSASAPALNNLSITIRKGESVGFIGPSGSGKSTLIDVILGLLTPASGQVTVDGQDIQQNIRAWQDQIGYVPQSIFLTDDSLRRNVAFGMPSEQIDDAAMVRAIKAAQLEDFVSSLPDGLETLVGERGIRLSGGQRQRIGIARALYHDPAVLLLDEATSALDTVTERSLMQVVSALHGTKTILIVAHRYSTVEHCDRLYRLEQGRVVAEGSPDAMIHQQRGSITQAQVL